MRKTPAQSPRRLPFLSLATSLLAMVLVSGCLEEKPNPPTAPSPQAATAPTPFLEPERVSPQAPAPPPAGSVASGTIMPTTGVGTIAPDQPLQPSIIIKVPTSSPVEKPKPAPPVAIAIREPAPPEPAMNNLILKAIATLPKGGGYAVSRAAVTGLRASLTCKDAKLTFDTPKAQPSFCSGATYLVFVHAIAKWHEARRQPLPDAVLQQLLVQGQADGVGVWGRWNANGPGTARLFTELGIGVNFQSLEDAQPGDFLKIWWNEHVGKREFGHSVIFLGLARTEDGSPGVRFWSSNQPDGYGEKIVPLTKARRILLSRITDPERAAATLPKLPKKDAFLAEMLTRDCSDRELAAMTGMPLPPEQPAPKAVPVVEETPPKATPVKAQASPPAPVPKAQPVTEKLPAETSPVPPIKGTGKAGG